MDKEIIDDIRFNEIINALQDGVVFQLRYDEEIYKIRLIDEKYNYKVEQWISEFTLINMKSPVHLVIAELDNLILKLKSARNLH